MAWVYGYTQKCKQCGEDFKSKRWDAQFCGQNCRKAHGRKRENANRDGQRLFADMKQYMKLLDDPDVKEVAMGWLMQIQRHSPALSVTVAAVTDNHVDNQ